MGGVWRKWLSMRYPGGRSVSDHGSRHDCVQLRQVSNARIECFEVIVELLFDAASQDYAFLASVQLGKGSYGGRGF
jgi:hypothetical protein